ncbi:Uncharacterized conserved protein [Salimicrobium halophilum]|uniref:Uncharacterized conserved protein n=1 Tax=Salimicrobium halophilum TaxID=86666 RepID=A0A1G8W572_9BACI|nr:Uncharacterized conserved protein [Salimicrobium halophilum]
MNCGWQGSIQEFLQLPYEVLEEALTTFVYGAGEPQHSEEELEKVQSQQRAWKDSYEKMQSILRSFDHVDGSIIFEYALIRGSGRRPDILLILPGQILVIECKSYNAVHAGEYMQTSLYVRDLQHYHSTIQASNVKVSGVLFLTNDQRADVLSIHRFQVYQASQRSLGSLISKLLRKGEAITADRFLSGTYQPSPSMLEAARSILNDEDLPRIKAVDSSNFEDVYDTVQDVIQVAQRTNTHHLVLVSGEPGAGKTFLGLQTAHNTSDSVYLSGNGPLVEVLQDTLNNKVFVQSLYGYKTDFLRYGRTPHEQVIIFDEAQRAWDAEKMGGAFSEPEVIIQIAKQNKPWSVVVGLIGNGQEIHLGEESGLPLWDAAIKEKEITVHAKHENRKFPNAAGYESRDHLHLNSSLRSHAALQYYAFIQALLEGDVEKALELKQPLQPQRYPIFVTDDLHKAKEYMSYLYKDDKKTFGIICASGVDRLKHVPVVPFGNRNELPKPATAYFNYPSSSFYCKNLNYAATEFQTQGLELDASIVHWDADLCWKEGQWHCKHTKRNARDPEQMKINAYRVLLTRGRDTTVIYLPNKPELKSTWDLFVHTLQIPILP